jgi:hypothetical protein
VALAGITSVQPIISNAARRSINVAAITQRIGFGDQIELVGAKEVPSMAEARRLERVLKRKKNPRIAISILQSTDQ